MIHSLELTNYRGFEHYKLSNLARVNLLVGKNNSGKTSILEAVCLLASEGDLRRFAEIARRRGEVRYALDEGGFGKLAYINPSRFFFGHDALPGARFAIRAETSAGPANLQVEVVDGDIQEPGLMIDIQGERAGPGARWSGHRIPASEEGFISFRDVPRRPHRNRPSPEDGPVQFVTQESLDRSSMRAMWDQIIIDAREHEVVGAMRLLEPRVSGIAFLIGDVANSFEPRDGILIGLEGEQRRQPLGSQGEGMRRLLALALVLTNTRNGVLLIDEVDTGLHYSVLGDVWLLIVETAKRYNIQVFLTTHSLDCVRALGWLCEMHPELAAEVSLQKIERALDEAVAFNADQIQIAVEQDIEVR